MELRSQGEAVGANTWGNEYRKRQSIDMMSNLPQVGFIEWNRQNCGTYRGCSVPPSCQSDLAGRADITPIFLLSHGHGVLWGMMLVLRSPLLSLFCRLVCLL
jgi:hypothetical protein